MLTKRIIPCLDVTAGRVVKGIHFENLRDAGNPVELAAYYNREGADELVFLDITATYENRATMLDVVRKTAEEVFIPVTVGGGIGKLEHLYEGLTTGGADALLAASIFHFGQHRINDVKCYLQARGVWVRPC